MSLGARFVIVTFILTVLSLTVVFIVDYRWHQATMLENLKQSSEFSSELLRHAFEEPMRLGRDKETQEKFQSLSLFGEVELYLTDHTGTITYSNRSQTIRRALSEIHPQAELTTVLRTTLARSGNHADFLSLDGHNNFVDIKTVFNSPQCYHCHGSKKTILGAVVIIRNVDRQFNAIGQFHKERLSILCVNLAILLLAMLFYFRLRVVSRIKALERSANAIAHGHLDASFEVSGNDEITRLAKHLTAMRRTRRRHEAQLTELNRDLESRVRERTGELAGAYEELQELYHMKTEFLSSVSHELRTPLASLYGFAKVIDRNLRDKVLPALEQKQEDEALRRAVARVRENLAMMTQAGDDLNMQISRILDYTDMESGRADWRMEDISPLDPMTRSIARFQDPMRDKGLNLVAELPDSLPTIRGDAARLEQAMDQLLANALQFTEQGSVTVSAQARGKDIVVSVEDTGPGIAPEMQTKIFDKFLQLGGHLTDKTSGVGLGLSICREIIERHGGQIMVCSAPVSGSIFRFTLPLPGRKD